MAIRDPDGAIKCVYRKSCDIKQDSVLLFLEVFDNESTRMKYKNKRME